MLSRDEAHQLVDAIFQVSTEVPEPQEDAPARVLPEGKRVVRTKSSGDRVYFIDEVISESHPHATRQWVTNGDILGALGFLMEDVTEVEDTELLKYQMGPAVYRVDNADA